MSFVSLTEQDCNCTMPYLVGIATVCGLGQLGKDR